MDFIEDYFINPLLVNGFFNPVNSIIYAVILIIVAMIVYLKILKPMKIKIDRNFAFALLPFVFWAGSTRVLRDFTFSLAHNSAINSNKLSIFTNDIFYQISSIQSESFTYLSTKIPISGFNGFFSWVIALFPTPGSYILTFIFALVSLIISILIHRHFRKPYWKVMFFIGFLACALNIYLLPALDFYPFALIIGITLLWSALFFLITKFSKTIDSKILEPVKTVFSPINSTLLSAHMLDASATFVALSFFGYFEQHPLPRLLIELTNPAAMFLLKLVVMIPVLYLIEKNSEPGDFKNFLKIMILILGLAPGLRDMIRLMVGV